MFTIWSDLCGLSRLKLVLPFLAVVRSPEANGVLTDAALRSIQAFLGERLIGEFSQGARTSALVCVMHASGAISFRGRDS